MKKVIAILALCVFVGVIFCGLPGFLGKAFTTAGGLALLAIIAILLNLLDLKYGSNEGINLGE